VVVTIAKTLDQPGFSRNRMYGCNGFEAIGVVEKIDRGPIAKLRNDQSKELIEGRLQIQGFRENLAGLRYERKVLSQPAMCVDVRTNADPAQHAAFSIVRGSRVNFEPPVRPVAGS